MCGIEPDAAQDFGDWLARFEAGDDLAVEQLVDVFYQRLVQFARRRLAEMPPQIADDEGAVISALRSFFSGIQDGKFPRITDEQDLWRILATITARKAIRQLRAHWKARGQGAHIARLHDINQLLSPGASPEQEIILNEEWERCLNAVHDATAKQIVAMKLEGSDNREIAERLGIHIRSVQRKLKLIESQWLEDTTDMP